MQLTNFKVKFAIEAVELHKRTVSYLFHDDQLPEQIIDKCPKQIAADILESSLGLKINPYEIDWVIINLLDVITSEDSVYIVFGATIPEAIPTKIGEWIECSKLPDKNLNQVDSHILKRFVMGH